MPRYWLHDGGDVRAVADLWVSTNPDEVYVALPSGIGAPEDAIVEYLYYPCRYQGQALFLEQRVEVMPDDMQLIYESLVDALPQGAVPLPELYD